MNIKVVVLAAGEGVRMRPLTYTRSKTMLPLANRPLLEHILIKGREAGLFNYIFVVGYHEEGVQQYFGNGADWKVSIEYCLQKQQLGTADAIRAIQGLVHEKFLVINGDNIFTNKDIERIVSNNDTTLGIFEMDNNKDLGSVFLDGDRVLRIVEKAEKDVSRLVNAGIYLFTPSIFEAISHIPRSARGEYEITDALQSLIDGGGSVKWLNIESWINLSYPWDLLAANEYLLKNMDICNEGIVEPNVILKGQVGIGLDTTIRSGAYIVGPVIIGSNCDVGPNCYIRPFTSIGNHCHIGAAVEVKHSIIMQNCKIPHQSYIGDSVIGEGCNFGAGTKVANLRFDNQNVIAGGVETGRRKLGAIIGDRVKTGINATINTGSMIGNNTFIGPGAIVHGIISPDSRIN